MDRCFNCGKVIEEKHEGAVTLSVGGESGASYCSSTCFSSGLRKEAKSWKASGGDLKKYIKAQKKEYLKKRVENIKKNKILNMDEHDAWYLFDSLSPKQKRTCALKGFAIIITQMNYDVKKILDVINN